MYHLLTLILQFILIVKVLLILSTNFIQRIISHMLALFLIVQIIWLFGIKLLKLSIFYTYNYNYFILKLILGILGMILLMLKSLKFIIIMIFQLLLLLQLIYLILILCLNRIISPLNNHQESLFLRLLKLKALKNSLI